MYKVFQATCDNPLKNDFVETCTRYMESLGLDLTFEDMRKMTKQQLKKIVDQKTNEAAFKYLLEKQNEAGKQTKFK